MNTASLGGGRRSSPDDVAVRVGEEGGIRTRHVLGSRCWTPKRGRESVPFFLLTMLLYSRVRLLLNRRDTHKAPPVVINKRVAGSGTEVTEKFAWVNVGSTPG